MVGYEAGPGIAFKVLGREEDGTPILSPPVVMSMWVRCCVMSLFGLQQFGVKRAERPPQCGSQASSATAFSGRRAGPPPATARDDLTEPSRGSALPPAPLADPSSTGPKWVSAFKSVRHARPHACPPHVALFPT